MMTYYECNLTLGDLENPQDDLLLRSGLGQELFGSLLFFLDRHAIALIAVSVAASVIGLVPLKLIEADRVMVLSWFVTTFSLLPAIIMFAMISGNRPASPGYVLAALRRLSPQGRRELLERLNTVALRGQHLPFSRHDVITTAKSIARNAAPGKRMKEVRRRHTAQFQASLIDAFRHG
jgi:hypothetical protein